MCCFRILDFVDPCQSLGTRELGTGHHLVLESNLPSTELYDIRKSFYDYLFLDVVVLLPIFVILEFLKILLQLDWIRKVN